VKAHRRVLQNGAKMLSISVQTVAYSVISKFKVDSIGCDLTFHKRNTKRKGNQIRHTNLKTDISIVIRVR